MQEALKQLSEWMRQTKDAEAMKEIKLNERFATKASKHDTEIMEATMLEKITDLFNQMAT